MIIYFCDRNLEILGHASTSLPEGLRLSDDLTTQEIESGATIFTGVVNFKDEERLDLEEALKPGNFILKGTGTAFEDSENTENSLFQVIETVLDSKKRTLEFYAEDAGLDLINKVVPATKLTSKTLAQMMASFLPGDWTLNLIGTPTGTKSYKWEGENTATERLISVAGLFGCELYYSFVIERFKVSKRVVNVIPKRGSQIAEAQLRLNIDIDRIITTSTIANLATALSVTGGTPTGKETPINLKNYNYSYTDPKTGDVYVVDKSTGQMRNTSAMKRWSNVLDRDGLVIKSYSFDATSQATLAGQARAELQKLSKMYVNYEVDFTRLPEGTQIGDRVNIIDEDGELYLEARILKIETSAADQTQTAVLGEFLIKSSGISEEMRTLISELAKSGVDGITMSISSSGGNIFHGKAIATTLAVTIFVGNTVISTQEQLTETFGDDASVLWISDGEVVATGFNLQINSNKDIENYKARLDI